MEEGDIFFFFSISFERFAVSAMISFFFFWIRNWCKGKGEIYNGYQMGFFFFFSYRMNILVR